MEIWIEGAPPDCDPDPCCQVVVPYVVETADDLELLYEQYVFHFGPPEDLDFDSEVALLGKKIGNAHLKWAFSEVAVMFPRHSARGMKLYQRLKKKHGKGKSLTVLAHKLARAMYFMLRREQVFDLDRFVAC